MGWGSFLHSVFRPGAAAGGSEVVFGLSLPDSTQGPALVPALLLSLLSHNQTCPCSWFVGGFSLSSGGCSSLSFPRAASALCLGWAGREEGPKAPGIPLLEERGQGLL